MKEIFFSDEEHKALTKLAKTAIKTSFEPDKTQVLVNANVLLLLLETYAKHDEMSQRFWETFSKK